MRGEPVDARPEEMKKEFFFSTTEAGMLLKTNKGENGGFFRCRYTRIKTALDSRRHCEENSLRLVVLTAVGT